MGIFFVSRIYNFIRTPNMRFLLVTFVIALAQIVASQKPDSCFADVGFLVDDSGSIDVQEYGYIQNFLRSLVALLEDLVDTEAHLGLASFSNDEKTHCLFSNHPNTASFIAAVNGLVPRQSAFTRLDKGFRLFAGPCSPADPVGKQCIFNGPGDRMNIGNTLVVITDGRPTSNEPGKTNEDIATAAAVKAGILHGRGVRVVAIAVGINDDNTRNYLRDSIASSPDLFFQINGFTALNTIISELLAIVCPAKTTTQRTIPTTLPDPVQQCRECLARDNQRQFYPDQTDCHRYLQCYLDENGAIVQISMPCSPGTYWNDEVLTCTRDVDPGTGPQECLDPCNPSYTIALFAGVAAAGTCWFDDAQSCLYWKCTNANSQPHCCPPGLEFTLSSCSCTNATSTMDSCAAGTCQLPGPGEDTTTAPIDALDGTCTDRRGRRLSVNALNVNTFIHILDDGSLNSEIMVCAPGTSFSVVTCDCQESASNPAPAQRLPACMLHLTMDEGSGQFVDSSVFKHYILNRGVLSVAGVYNGAGAFNSNSLLEVPAFMSNDFRNDASFCLLYSCDGPCNGGLLSNSRNPTVALDMWSVRMSTSAPATVSADATLWHPDSTHSVTQSGNVAFDPSGFVQACSILRETTWELWINGVLVQTVDTPGGDLAIRHCPITIGSDHFFGNFTGSIEEVLICDHAMDALQVTAHLNNDIGYLQSLGLLPV